MVLPPRAPASPPAVNLLPPRPSSRLLVLLVPLAIAGHAVLVGSRVTVSLAALAQGASPLTVGVLIALYALLPMLSAVAAGRLSDRIGVRIPMLFGAAGLAVGVVLPLFSTSLPVLCASATIVGLAFMVFQLATQRVTGEIGGPLERARNFSLLALAYSISGSVSPLAVGFTIDHAGFGAAFAGLGVVGLALAAVLGSKRLPLPRPQPAPATAHHGGVRGLLRHRNVRRVLIVNVLMSVGWDLHTVFVPIYGAKLGLAASQIGMVLASFAVATLLVRLAMPAIARRATEHRVLSTALLGAGVVYCLFPFAQGAPTLGVLSFFLGLCLGSGQPMVMSLLHLHAPAGRVGEAVGVRMSLVQSSSVAVPLLFGAVGSSLGLAPVFWSVGVCLAASGYLTRRGPRG